jgi:hypothetical protein
MLWTKSPYWPRREPLHRKIEHPSRESNHCNTENLNSAHGTLTVREDTVCLYLNASVHSNGQADVTGCWNERGYASGEYFDPKVLRLPAYLLVRLRNVFRAKWSALVWRERLQCQYCAKYLTVSVPCVDLERTKSVDQVQLKNVIKCSQ